MDAGLGTPLLDFFRRGEVDRDVRLMVAQGILGLRPHEQLGLLELLVNDPDPEVAGAARESLQTSGATTLSAEEEAASPHEDERSLVQKIAAMSPGQRLQTAMRGGREERAILIRDANKLVALAVLSSPKITESEVENIAKMSNVSDDILRTIGHTRAWVKSYTIVAALTRNPKTPVALSLNLLSRLMEKDVKSLTTDRNVPDVVRLAARKKLTPSR